MVLVSGGLPESVQHETRGKCGTGRIIGPSLVSRFPGGAVAPTASQWMFRLRYSGHLSPRQADDALRDYPGETAPQQPDAALLHASTPARVRAASMDSTSSATNASLPGSIQWRSSSHVTAHSSRLNGGLAITRSYSSSSPWRQLLDGHGPLGTRVLLDRVAVVSDRIERVGPALVLAKRRA